MSRPCWFEAGTPCAHCRQRLWKQQKTPYCARCYLRAKQLQRQFELNPHAWGVGRILDTYGLQLELNRSESTPRR